MQSDPWWSLAMAINVLLVFYFRASPNSFQRWWWLYCIICYGGPMMIALILLVVKDIGKGPVYGDATVRRAHLTHRSQLLPPAPLLPPFLCGLFPI